MDFVNRPNVSTPIQGSSSVVKRSACVQGKHFYTCFNRGGDGGGRKVNNGGGGKVNNGGGGTMEVISDYVMFIVQSLSVW